MEIRRRTLGGDALALTQQMVFSSPSLTSIKKLIDHRGLLSKKTIWCSTSPIFHVLEKLKWFSVNDMHLSGVARLDYSEVFEQEIKGASKTSTSAQNVAFVSQSRSNTNKVKSGLTGTFSTCNPSTSSSNIPEREAPAGFADEVIYSLFAKQSEDLDLLHEDLEQIDDVDIEEMDINWQIAMIAIRMKKFYKKTGRRVRIDGKAPVGFDKKKLECYKCHNTGHFARECTSKGTNDGKKKTDSVYQDQESGKQEKNQIGLLTMDDGVVNWGDHTAEEETNHALMAISSNYAVSLWTSKPELSDSRQPPLSILPDKSNDSEGSLGNPTKAHLRLAAAMVEPMSFAAAAATVMAC
ncbi:ribonuclease H-like domain-containing protein [Tanacetum coccineum]